jgi:protease-4
MEIAHESIFVSTIRSFCKVFFGAIGLFAALFVLQIVYSMFSSPFSNEMKTAMVLQPNLENEYGHPSMSSPVVLQIHIDGVIGDLNGITAESIEDILLDSRQGYLAGDRVKAILLCVNTPGGGAIESDNIYTMLNAYKEKFKTPIYAYVNGLCASGGMFVTSAADKLYATPPSIIGSVGVILGPFFNVSDTMTKYGVKSMTLTEGTDKDTLTPYRPWKPDEAAEWQPILAANYERFLNIVTGARKGLDKEKLKNVYGARVYSSGDALKYGYIDVADADYKRTLTDLMVAANIDPQKPYQVIELRAKKDWLGPVHGLLQGKLEHKINLQEKKLAEGLSYLYQ